MKDKILGIEDIKELDFLEDKLMVRIHLKYPDYEDILHLQPKERIKIIRQRKRKLYKDFLGEIDKREFKRIGSKISPSGLEIFCAKKEILNLKNDKRIANVSILTKQLDNEVKIERYYSVKARFAIQIENRTKGIQTYEDRILLMKAKNGEDAKRKLVKKFKNYEEPYLNPYGELVRWKFEEFIDLYETVYSSMDDMLSDEKEGIEVFSVLKTRKLNTDRSWIKENEK